MTLAVQVSVKKSDGTIYVVGGVDFENFSSNALALLEGDEGAFQELLEDLRRSLTPMASAVNTVQAAMPGSHVVGQDYYTPQPAPAGVAGAPRTSAQPVAVHIPWPDKAAADPYLTPLKATRQARWDANSKSWVLNPGVDLTPFARWLPPGM